MADYKDIITGTIASLMDKVKGVAESGAVRNVYEQGASKAKSYGQFAKYAFEVNGDKEELKRVFCEIGKLYFDQAKDAPGEFYAPLFEQANEILQRIAEKEEYIKAVKSEYAAAHQDGIDVEVCDFEEVVSATEEDGVTVEVTSEETEEKTEE